MTKTVHLRSHRPGTYEVVPLAELAHLTISAVPEDSTAQAVANLANKTSIAYRDNVRPTVEFSRLGRGNIVNLYNDKTPWPKSN